MTTISLPTAPEIIESTLKADETIVCIDAIVAVDSRGEITWWDKNKMINIISEREK